MRPSVNNQRRAEAEQLALLRELAVADTQLAGREDAHSWQCDSLREQLEQVRARHE